MSLCDHTTWPKENIENVVFDYDKAMDLFLSASSQPASNPAEFGRGPWRLIENAFLSAGYIWPKDKRKRYARGTNNEREFVYNPTEAQKIRQANNKKPQRESKRRLDDQAQPEGKRFAFTPVDPQLLFSAVPQLPPALMAALAMQQPSSSAPSTSAQPLQAAPTNFLDFQPNTTPTPPGQQFCLADPLPDVPPTPAVQATPEYVNQPCAELEQQGLPLGFSTQPADTPSYIAQPDDEDDLTFPMLDNPADDVWPAPYGAVDLGPDGFPQAADFGCDVFGCEPTFAGDM